MNLKFQCKTGFLESKTMDKCEHFFFHSFVDVDYDTISQNTKTRIISLSRFFRCKEDTDTNAQNMFVIVSRSGIVHRESETRERERGGGRERKVCPMILSYVMCVSQC